MNPKALVISFAAGAVTTWATKKLMRKLNVPAAAAPVVGSAVGVVVNKAVQRLR